MGRTKSVHSSWMENGTARKNRALLVREKRYGTDKMERSWLCENTANLYKVGGEFFFWEDDS
ncbi:hypothetical protein T11_1008 [Trichinella zimbabwensis]|uniref:Uncharacterized protein n=1 Tax=Trichinella zimbabwensis TaxID=268475 RepID=A0A0V1GGN0_9BILA|nr:hypothetical protein T11_1008 [Trichinella zimbabwensis]